MPAQLSADVVVIGSGICGCLAAERLARSGRSVLILEAGPRVTRAQLVLAYRRAARKGDWMAPYPPTAWAPHPTYQPHEGSDTDQDTGHDPGSPSDAQGNGYLVQAGPYPYPAEYIRAVGGTTWHWAAQMWRYLPNDFRIRSLYGVGQGLADHLRGPGALVLRGRGQDGRLGGARTPARRGPGRSRCSRWRRCGPCGASASGSRRGGYPVVSNTTARNSRPYDGRPACCGANNCQPICPVDAQYTGGVAVAAAERAGVRIEPNAVVYRIEHDPRGRIAAVHYYDPDKGSHRVTGRQFILAANGIESPKLLLMSASADVPERAGQQLGHGGAQPLRPPEQLAHLRRRRGALARARSAESGVDQHPARRAVPLASMPRSAWTSPTSRRCAMSPRT